MLLPLTLRSQGVPDKARQKQRWKGEQQWWRKIIESVTRPLRSKDAPLALQNAAAEAMGAMGEAAGKSGIKQLVKAALDYEQVVHVQARRSLGACSQFSAVHALPLLRKAMNDDGKALASNPQRRCVACQTVGALGAYAGSAYLDLVKIMSFDEDEECRRCISLGSLSLPLLPQR